MNFFSKFLENVLRYVCCLLNLPSTPTPPFPFTLNTLQGPPIISYIFVRVKKKFKEILRVQKFFDKNDVFLYKTPFVIYFLLLYQKNANFEQKYNLLFRKSQY